MARTRDVELGKPEQVADMPNGLWLVHREDGRVLATLVEKQGDASDSSPGGGMGRRKPVDKSAGRDLGGASAQLPASSIEKFFGSIALEGPTDVAANKHKYLGEYYGHTGD